MSLQAQILIVLSFIAFSIAHAAPESVPGEFVVKLKPQLRSFSTQMLSQVLRSHIKSQIAQDSIVVIQRPKIELESFVIQLLSENPLVENVEPNYVYRASKIPNDPSFLKLWGLSNTGQSDVKGLGTAGIDIDAVRAWEITQGSEDTVVAVIDTGVDYTHPDLKSNMWTNAAELNGRAGVDDDGNGYVDDIYGYNFVDAAKPVADPKDDNGHGSHCAGTIGARGDDGQGIVGVNWKVKIMALKFLGADGSGTLEGAIKSIDYAVENGAKILSNSWGGGGESQTMREAIQRANTAGVIFVAAAGNEAANNDLNPHYPASYEVPNVLSVAAIDNNGRIASFSNYGKRTTHIAAPGVNIYSSYLQSTNGYNTLSGTSMATPHVSGVVALLSSHEPNLTGLQLKQRVISSARLLANVKNKVSSGGILNAYMALTDQVSQPDPNDPDLWHSKAVSFSSAHPYANKANQSFEVQISGAKEIALYFERFETEKDYDPVSFYDRAGKLIGTLSGSTDESYGPTVPGDYVKIVFTSDDSVVKHGFDLTKAAYH